MERQLRRWSQQWDASKTAELPALDALRDDLVAARPEQRASAVVHGDYRLDNTILHPTKVGAIVAVLDWEMSTLGDPLADLGAMLAYWSEAADSEVLRRTGIDPSNVNWYQSFAYFKLAVVCQGIAARAAGGSMVGEGFDDAERVVAPLVEAGREQLSAGPAA
jgi:aminoglycoside phosphotransferase (APT) family kinase protein